MMVCPAKDYDKKKATADGAPTSAYAVIQYTSSNPTTVIPVEVKKSYQKIEIFEQTIFQETTNSVTHTTGTTSGIEFDFSLSSIGTFRIRKNSTYASSCINSHELVIIAFLILTSTFQGRLHKSSFYQRKTEK